MSSTAVVDLFRGTLPRIVFFAVGMLMLLSATNIQAAGKSWLWEQGGKPKCDRCKRRFLLIDFINPHATEWDIPDPDDQYDRWDAYNECLVQNTPEDCRSFDEVLPCFDDVLEACKHLKPKLKPRAMDVLFMGKGMVQSEIEQVFRSNCFRMGGNPEYVFEGMFVDGLKGEVDNMGKKIRSRLTIRMFYDGLYREHLKTWVTEGFEKTDEHGHINRMFVNRRKAKMRQDRPIEPFLWDYEKMPATCEIEIENPTVMAGHRTEVKLSGIVDGFDRPSKDFNRLVATTDTGRLLGDEPLKVNPAWAAALVGEGTIPLVYEAPEKCAGGQATIQIYNSCDILDLNRQPLSETTVKDKIAEKQINILCPDTAILYMIMHGARGRGSSKTNYQISATVQLELGKTEGSSIHPESPLDPGMLESTISIRSQNIIAFSARKTFIRSSGTETWVGSSPKFRWLPSEENPITLIHDPKSRSVQYAILPDVVIDFSWSGIAQYIETIHLGVVQQYQQPPKSLHWSEDQRVTRGDGLKHFGGSGWRVTRKGDATDDYRWTWDIAIK